LVTSPPDLSHPRLPSLSPHDALPICSEMLEHLPLDYVRTARSKGLREQVVVLRHVLRNSLIPVVTLVALGVPAVFGGAIVTEQIFRVPGIGELLVRSIGDGDTPVVAAILLIFAVLVVLLIYKTKIDVIDFTLSLKGPSPEHPLGNDELGRDLLARIMFGGRVSIAVGITAVLLAITLGTSIGAMAGFFGRLDNPLMR